MPYVCEYIKIRRELDEAEMTVRGTYCSQARGKGVLKEFFLPSFLQLGQEIWMNGSCTSICLPKLKGKEHLRLRSSLNLEVEDKVFNIHALCTLWSPLFQSLYIIPVCGLLDFSQELNIRSA